MPQKRKPTRKAKIHQPQSNKRGNRQQPGKWENLLLRLLYSSAAALSLAAMQTFLEKEGGKEQDLAKAVDSLLHEGLITKGGKTTL